jgi:hypothetical protein
LCAAKRKATKPAALRQFEIGRDNLLMAQLFRSFVSLREMDRKVSNDLCDEPLVIVVHRGAVILNGPGNVALAMTVDAAEKSGEMLVTAAQRARRGRPAP